ncbi:MAG: hypothetical protein AAF456_00470 [Planctomycetota bacterium]
MLANKYTVLLIWISAALVVVGCNRPVEEIVTHEMPKSESGLDLLNEPPPFLQEIMDGGGRGTEGPTVPARMVVAITERGDDVWFFKIQGAADQVAETEPVWREFFGTLAFENNEPVWTLPDGWSADTEAQDRFATIAMNDAEPPLEMAVTVFAMRFAPLMNVNRWRGQIMLPPLPELESELPTIPGSGFDFVLFDETGEMNDPTGAPVVSGESVEASQPEQQITFDIPDGWEAEESSMSFIRTRLARKDGEREVKITVSEMSTQNGWDDVVGQWSSQAGFTALDEDGVAERVSEVAIAGEAVRQIRLVSDDEEVVTGVIGAMLNRGDINWFFKLHGEKQLVVESEEDFAVFLASFKFDDDESGEEESADESGE